MRTTTTPAVSVIIPMYNVSGKTDRMLDCILRQGVDAAEYIFVDDSSSDATFSTIKEWIEAHKTCGPSFHMLKHAVNQGVACARNTGLDHAKGKFVYFMDADDYLEDGTLAKMLDTAHSTHADIVGIEWYLTFGHNERRMRQVDAQTGEELLNTLCYGVSRWNLWLFMIRRELFEKISLRFIPGCNMGEDMMAMLKLATLARKVKIIHRPLYHYMQTNPNAITQHWSDEHRRQVTANLENAQCFLTRQGNYIRQIECLKLNLKLPLIISDNVKDFEKWQQWWPESNAWITENPLLPRRTRWLQLAAAKKHYRLLKIYYHFVIKFIYGIVFK